MNEKLNIVFSLEFLFFFRCFITF